MSSLAIILIALAGCGCVVAAGLRWRGRPVGAVLAGAFVLLTAGVLSAAIDGTQRDVLAGSLAVWAAFGSLLFVVRSLAAPTPWLLLLPAGAVALLIAVASLVTGRAAGATGSGTVMVYIHAGFQIAHLAALLVAAGAAGTWLMASGKLKRFSPTALRMPTLPILERLSLRFAVAAAALLIGGVATGGFAMVGSTVITLAHPAVWCAVVTLAVLCLGLASYQVQVLPQRVFYMAIIIAAVPSVAGALLLVAGRHG